MDEDWRDRDPDALRAAAVTEVPLLEGATHCFVAATITRSPGHPLGRLLGDALVLEASASGRARDRRIPFGAEDGMHVGGTHHLALLNHPEVYERLARLARLSAQAVAEVRVLRGQHREDEGGGQSLAAVVERIVHELDQRLDVRRVAEVVPGLGGLGEQQLARSGLERPERAHLPGRLVHGAVFDGSADDPAT